MIYTINTIEQLKPVLVGFRKLRKMSQKDVAKKLGVSQQTYQVLESNPNKVTMERLFRVLNLLGIKIQLVDGQQEHSNEYTKAQSTAKHEGDW